MRRAGGSPTLIAPWSAPRPTHRSTSLSEIPAAASTSAERVRVQNVTAVPVGPRCVSPRSCASPRVAEDVRTDEDPPWFLICGFRTRRRARALVPVTSGDVFSAAPYGPTASILVRGGFSFLPRFSLHDSAGRWRAEVLGVLCQEHVPAAALGPVAPARSGSEIPRARRLGGETQINTRRLLPGRERGGWNASVPLSLSVCACASAVRASLIHKVTFMRTMDPSELRIKVALAHSGGGRGAMTNIPPGPQVPCAGSSVVTTTFCLPWISPTPLLTGPGCR